MQKRHKTTGQNKVDQPALSLSQRDHCKKRKHNENYASILIILKEES